MKFLRVIFLLTVVALIWSGVHEKAVIARLQTKHETLVAHSTAIGLPEKESDDAKALTRLSGRGPSQKSSPEHLKDDLIATYHRLKGLEGSDDPETRMKVEAEVREWIGRLIVLPPKELKRMIADLTSDSSLDPKEVSELVSVALNLAASRQAETAAELALAHRDSGIDLGGIIHNWAGQEPAGAFAWLEKNKEAIGKDYNKAWEEAVKQSASPHFSQKSIDRRVLVV